MTEIIRRPRDKLPHWKVRVVWIDNFDRFEIEILKAIDLEDAVSLVAGLPLAAREGYSLTGVTVFKPDGTIAASRGVN